MATERTKNIRGTRTDLGAIVRRTWLNAKDSECAPLTFGDLAIGERYISLPMPGDNSGRGGLLGSCHIFRKIRNNRYGAAGMLETNSRRMADGAENVMPDEAWVISVD